MLGKNNARILAERNRWLRRFGQQHLFPKQDIEDALAEPLDAQRHAAPALAPHLARRLVTQFPGRPSSTPPCSAASQAKAEDLTRNYVRRLHELGISQAAVLVVNNRTRAVEAYVGSADFADAASSGQVDGVRAIRSPGSTLKPFLYALALDRGLVTPKLKLPDVPTNFSGFRPENFDKSCAGEVTVERALTYSLNIPAVRVLADVGVPRFHRQAAGGGLPKRGACRAAAGPEHHPGRLRRHAGRADGAVRGAGRWRALAGGTDCGGAGVHLTP